MRVETRKERQDGRRMKAGSTQVFLIISADLGIPQQRWLSIGKIFYKHFQ